MDKREAKRQAHKLVAGLIDGQFGNYGEPLASNDDDHERIMAALREIGQQHFKKAKK